MKILLDVESVSNLMDNSNRKALLESVIGVLSSCDVQVDVLDKCLNDLRWRLGSLGFNLCQVNFIIKQIECFLEKINVKVIKTGKYQNMIYASDYHDFGLCSSFHNLQLSYLKRNQYCGLLTYNSEIFQHTELEIFPLNKFMINYQFEKLYSQKEPIIISYSIDCISTIWRQRLNIYSINSQRRGLISSLPNFIEYLRSPYIDPEYFFRVIREIDRNFILDIVRIIKWNRFGKTIICSTNNIEITVHCWNKNGEGKYHIHKNSMCASYILSGELTEENYETGKVIKYPENTWNFVDFGTHHKLSNRSSVGLTLVVFKVFKLDNLGNIDIA